MGMFHHHSRDGKRLQRKSKSEHHSGVRLAAFLLCLSMLAGFLPAVARAADRGPLLSSIVTFGSITLHYAGADGQPEEEAIQDNTLIEKNRQLALSYTYTIKADQCDQITAGTNYYLNVPPHLVLPSGLEKPLTTEDTKEQFGTLHMDGNHAWVTFLPNTDGSGTILSDYVSGVDFEDAYFYLTCNRANDVPVGEIPIEGHSNLYAMKFENNTQLNFGYAENEPVTAKAIIEKGGKYESTNKTITWTIGYTPWQNPAEGDDVTLETPFELRDTIDTSLHSYVDNGVMIDGQTVTAYTSRDEVQGGEAAYVIVETPADGCNTTLTFGGTKFNAGQATKGNPATSLKITYQTEIKDELLLPTEGNKDGKRVTNTAELFAGPDFENQLRISGEAAVTVDQPKWLTKTGKTTRNPGNGSTTDWEVVFNPNGFTFDASNSLTLYDQLPQGSEPVSGSLYVNGTQTRVTVGDDNSFTVSPIVPDGTNPVTITYQTHVPEEMYDSSTPLGSNIAYFTFNYGSDSYTTPRVETPIGSGDGSGQPGTSTLVKENKGYDTATRTIAWEVTINHHQAYLQSGTFTDNLGAVGPQTCGVSGHGHGLELVGGTAGVDIKISDNPNDKTGRAPIDEELELIDLNYDSDLQVLTVTVKKDGDGTVIGTKTITLTYKTRVCDPCIFANNTAKTALKNTISTTDMIIGTSAVEGRSASADSAADVSATVLTKKAPVYDYASGTMKWTVEVDAAGLSMGDVVLTDDLPAGLTYVDDSLATAPTITGASANVSGQTLTINLGAVTEKATITFDIEVDPEILGFGGDQPVVVKNTIRMNGKADGVEFAEVPHHVKQSFSNHGLVKDNTVDNGQELIRYEVLINPYHLALPENPSLVDTLDKRLQLDTDTLLFHKATLTGTTAASEQKPGYTKTGDGQSLKITGFDPAANSFTVQLPIPDGSTDAYVLTYTADMIDHQAGGYSNSVRFDGGALLLGGSKNNSATVGGGGGGGGGGVAARKATISIVKTDSETQAPLSGVSFLLYQWDSESNTRGLPFAQGTTDTQGKLSFKVKPGAIYELVEDESVPGYGSEFSWTNLPDGVRATDNGLLVTAGEAKSELKLELTNEAHTTDIVFRLVNESGIPMAGKKVKIFTFDPTVEDDPSPAKEVTVSSDGTVKFPEIRRGAKYYIQRPDGEIMSVDVPAQVNDEPKVTLPDGTTATLNEDYQATNTMTADQQWELTVKKVISGGDTPLAGATIGLYADEECKTLIKSDVSGKDGTITFSGLIKGQSYWLKETAAPNGYQLNSKTYAGTEGTPNVTIENTPSPVNPGNPGDPSNPVNPSDPSNPGDPGNPVNPSDPSNPVNPSDPSNPVNPSDPNNPVNPSDPSNPVNPSDPSNPVNPSDPSNPVNPGDPNNPVNPSDPGNPGIGNVSTGDPNIPQTGDYTQLLVLITLLSGILLAAMTLYRFLGKKKREKE